MTGKNEKLFVLNLIGGTSELLVLDRTSGELIKQIPLGYSPYATVLAESGKLFVVDTQLEAPTYSLHVYDTTSLTLDARIETPARVHYQRLPTIPILESSLDNLSVYMQTVEDANTGDVSVTRFDATTLDAHAGPVQSSCWGLRILPVDAASPNLWCTNRGALAFGESEANVPIPVQAFLVRSAESALDGSAIFIVQRDGEVMRIASTGDAEMLGRVSFPSNWEVLPAGSALSRDGARLYVAVGQEDHLRIGIADEIWTFDTSTGHAARLVSLPEGLTGFQLSGDGSEIYAFGAHKGTVTVVSIPEGQVHVFSNAGQSPIWAAGDR